jgi:hypothetical protein
VPRSKGTPANQRDHSLSRVKTSAMVRQEGERERGDGGERGDDESENLSRPTKRRRSSRRAELVEETGAKRRQAQRGCDARTRGERYFYGEERSTGRLQRSPRAALDEDSPCGSARLETGAGRSREGVWADRAAADVLVARTSRSKKARREERGRLPGGEEVWLRCDVAYGSRTEVQSTVK